MQKRFTVILLLLFTLTYGLKAATWNIQQDIQFSSNCDFNVNYDPSFSGNVASVTIAVSHDINGTLVGSPWLHNSINYDCWRYIRFRIYNATTNALVHTHTEYSRLLQGANYSASPGNPATGSFTHTLTGLELSNAGLNSGRYRVEAHVDYDYYSGTPHVVNVTTRLNGASPVTVFDAEGDDFSRTPGLLTCFTYCVNNASLLWNCTQVNPFWSNCTFSVDIPGGSGNYSYSWWSSAIGQGGTGPTFTMLVPNGLSPELFCTIIDNVTGCVFTVFSGGKRSAFDETAPELAPELLVYPNPAGLNQDVSLAFHLNEDAKVSVKIYDLTGRLVAEPHQQSSFKAGGHQLLIHAPLSNGTYMIRVTTDTGLSLSRRLVVN